jgi:hypothetical protein
MLGGHGEALLGLLMARAGDVLPTQRQPARHVGAGMIIFPHNPLTKGDCNGARTFASNDRNPRKTALQRPLRVVAAHAGRTEARITARTR